MIGTRRRKVIRETGDTTTLIIRRLRCDSCRKVHHELPDFIVPYKHHSADVIEQILRKPSRVSDSCSPCEDRTISRMIQWFTLLRPLLEAAIHSLIEMNRHQLQLVNELSLLLPLIPDSLPAGWLSRLVRALVNSGRWLQTRLALTVR